MLHFGSFVIFFYHCLLALLRPWLLLGACMIPEGFLLNLVQRGEEILKYLPEN